MQISIRQDGSTSNSDDCKKWRRCFRLGYSPNDQKADGRAEGCTRGMFESVRRMMLNVWKVQDEIEHGNNAFHSSRDIKILCELIDELYDKYQQKATGSDKWMFEKSNTIERKNL